MTSSLSFFFLFLVAAHESQCENLWQKFRTNYWESKDAMNCYRSVTLTLFENLKKVVDVIYVELGKKEFESKVKSRSKFFSYFNKKDETDENSLKKRIQEAETAAYDGIFTICQWLSYHCTDEKQEEIMEFTKVFKEGSAKCGDHEYLNDSILRLEQTCPEKGKEGIANGRPSYVWKSDISDNDELNDPWEWATI